MRHWAISLLVPLGTLAAGCGGAAAVATDDVANSVTITCNGGAPRLSSPGVRMDVDTVIRVTLQNQTPAAISLVVAGGPDHPIAAAEQREETWEFPAGPLEIACVRGGPSTSLEIVDEHPRRAAECDGGSGSMVQVTPALEAKGLTDDGIAAFVRSYHQPARPGDQVVPLGPDGGVWEVVRDGRQIATFEFVRADDGGSLLSSAAMLCATDGWTSCP